MFFEPWPRGVDFEEEARFLALPFINLVPENLQVATDECKCK